MADNDATSLPPPQAFPLLSSFTTFLTVAIHSLLYHRNLYPPETFLTSRAYNLPVHQSRHPAVCTWITDAVSAAAVQIRRAAVDRIILVVHAPQGFRVLERWVFDVAWFPADWGGGDEVNWADVNEALRGALRRIAYAAEKAPRLPDGCTFTLAVELRDEASAPIKHPQEWIPTEPEIQRPGRRKQKDAAISAWADGKSTTPIRSVQAGPLFFECWLEKPRPGASDDSGQVSGHSKDATSGSS